MDAIETRVPRSVRRVVVWMVVWMVALVKAFRMFRDVTECVLFSCFVAVLGSQTELGNGCIVGAMCNVSSHETLADNTVVYGSRCERRIQLERPPVL